MILNRVNENEEQVKDEEEKKDNNEKNEKNKKKSPKAEKEEEEEIEGEEEEDEQEGEEKEEEENEEQEEREEVEIGDSHRKKMIKSSNEPEENIKTLKHKIRCYKVFSVILVIIVFLIILIIILAARKGKAKIPFITKDSNITIVTTTPEINLSSDRLNQVRNELNNIYNNNGEVNVIKFYEETVNQKTYTPADLTRFKSVHISIGFNEKDLDIVIKHLGSAVYHSMPSTFLHIHMMDVDTLSYESLLKLKNMIYKINNNTEVIIYNAASAIQSFTVREGSAAQFAKEYARLYAFKLVKNVQIMIFLDIYKCVVLKDLTELYNLEMTDIYGRGITEAPSIRYSVEWMDKFLYDKSHFINGGVVLVNMELCQKEDFYHKIKELNNNEFYMKTEDPFQDALNVLMRKKIEFFHPKYNKINFYEKPEDKNDESKWYPWIIETLKQSEKNNHFYTKEEIMEADNDPTIVQYLWEKQLNKNITKYEDDLKFYGNMAGIA